MKTITYAENILEWQEEFSFYIPVRIRFSETDMFGHVNNVSPFIYFEEARIEFLKSLDLFGTSSSEEMIPVAADLQCDYLKQMFFNDSIRVYVKAADIGNTSVDLHYMILNQQDEICVTGRGRLVYINPVTGRPVRLTESMREKLKAN
ncbi:acyl-CoA thioesterase [Virgibacillus kekensis]|uniref:Acyl-CoA thioesterase n=1 Tax=Virgibacillus kekensis TaxID=202261 RepID=A0ABV9DD21_9BACI